MERWLTHRFANSCVCASLEMEDTMRTCEGLCGEGLVGGVEWLAFKLP